MLSRRPDWTDVRLWTEPRKQLESRFLLLLFWRIQERATEGPLGFIDRDRGVPHGTAPPTPPGIRVRTTAVRLSYAWAVT